MPTTPLFAVDRCYRLPWNLADNPITWLEPTTACNIHCDGCYRQKNADGHRPLEDVIRDLEGVRRLRRTDGISIAGGEPLLYPHIVDLVRYVKRQGWKPVIITNGTRLEPSVIDELRRAGLAAFTVHVDSHQHRPGWDGRNEQELNELRSRIAKTIHEAGRGRVACAFNATIYPDTVQHVPDLVRWAQRNIRMVQTMVFILFRQGKASGDCDYFAGGRQLNIDDAVRIPYAVDAATQPADVMADEVARLIRDACPEYQPCAYLNSNQASDVPKWLLAQRAGTPDDIVAYMDARFAEFNQVMHHLLWGTYLAYPPPWVMRNVGALLFLAPLNAGLRRMFGRWLRTPRVWLRSLSLQSLLILQPPDILADGRQAMCDGCPDAIYHNGRLLWKCRLEEVEKFGGYVQIVPHAAAPAESPVN